MQTNSNDERTARKNRSSRKGHGSRVVFEALETRQLLSTSLAHADHGAPFFDPVSEFVPPSASGSTGTTAPSGSLAASYPLSSVPVLNSNPHGDGQDLPGFRRRPGQLLGWV